MHDRSDPDRQNEIDPGQNSGQLCGAGCDFGGCRHLQAACGFAGAGATVPLTGFGYSIAKGVKEAISQDGFLGILTGGLKATAGGITAAIIAGLIASFLFKAKDKA